MYVTDVVLLNFTVLYVVDLFCILVEMYFSGAFAFVCLHLYVCVFVFLAVT